MCGEVNMVECTLLITTAAATFFAALAAWFSFRVSKNSLEFQKKYAKNQSLISELNRVLYKTETLQVLMPKPREMSDSELESLDILLKELKNSLERLNNRNIINYGSLKIYSIQNHFDLARDNDCLNEVVGELEKIKDGIFK